MSRSSTPPPFAIEIGALISPRLCRRPLTNQRQVHLSNGIDTWEDYADPFLAFVEGIAAVGGSADDFFANPELLLHEYVHVLRQWNRGRSNVADYLLEWYRRGYWQNRYERQARRFVQLRLAALREALARPGAIT